MKQGRHRADAPHPATETVRRVIGELIRKEPLSARDLSAQAHLPEKDVYDHLEHIRKSLQATDRRLAVIPAECRACGFVFTKRERLTPPGKCPRCRGEAIGEPLFVINRRGEQLP